MSARDEEWVKQQIDSFFSDTSRSQYDTYMGLMGLEDIIDHIHTLDIKEPDDADD